jgi:hypothetical protein
VNPFLKQIKKRNCTTCRSRNPKIATGGRAVLVPKKRKTGIGRPKSFGDMTFFILGKPRQKIKKNCGMGGLGKKYLFPVFREPAQKVFFV